MGTQYSSRDLIGIVQKDGWFFVKAEGSHHKFRHLDKAGTVIIPHPKKIVPLGTAKKILKIAGSNRGEGK